jgi:hypothetical protein
LREITYEFWENKSPFSFEDKKNAQLRVSLLDTQHHASDDEGNASPTGNLY